MNKERILELADVIEKVPLAGHVLINEGPKEPDHFNMIEWHCGSCACIGGWAEHIWKDEDNAAGALGLSYMQEARLFFMRDYRGKTAMLSVTPSQAASCLRHLAETGIVDWERALGETA